MDKLYMYGSNLCKYIHCVYNCTYCTCARSLFAETIPYIWDYFREKGPNAYFIKFPARAIEM